MRFLLLALFLPVLAWAEPKYNPLTGKFDYTGNTSTGSLSGSFVLKAGDTMTGSLTYSTSTIGVVLRDPAECRWLVGITVNGNLTSTLQGCPVASTGQCMGLLCAITQ